MAPLQPNKTKTQRPGPYNKPDQCLKPCKLRKPETVAAFQALVKEHGQRKKRGRPPKETRETSCEWCSKVTVQRETHTNIFDRAILTPRLSTLSTTTQVSLAQEIEDRWGTSNAEVDMSTFTNNQLAACLDFHKLASDTAPTSLRARLGQENMQSLVSVPEIQDLLRCFNRIFFPGACTDFVFAWSSNPGAVGSWAHEPQLGSSAVPAVQVRLHPTQCKSLPDYPRFSARAMGRLSTLLHEVVHAHLLVYACKICEPSYVAVEDAGGHGAAW
jgi:hypothetical protein